MDYDGDQTNIHVPVSDEAVKDALDKMLPSKHLYSAGDFKVHQLPIREFAAGLYLATRKTDPDRAPVMFATAEDAASAARRGEIGYDQPVEIVRH